MIKRVVRKGRARFALFTENGKHKLGEHATRKKAIAQEIAIHIAKARRAGHRIPRPTQRPKR